MFVSFINSVSGRAALRSKSSLPSRTPFRIRISCLTLCQSQVRIFGLPATFITVFLLLRPQNVFENYGTDHHAKDEEPASDEETSENAA